MHEVSLKYRIQRIASELKGKFLDIISVLPPKLILPVILLVLLNPTVMSQQAILEKTISMDAQTGTILEVLSKIEMEGGFSFSFNNCFPYERRVHIEADKKSVQQFLDDILSGLSVEYQEDKRTNKIMILDSESRLCQIFRGTVMDTETKSPLPGAHIVILYIAIMKKIMRRIE